MSGTKTITIKLTCLLAFAGSLFAAGPEYFPLETGNSWVYRVTQGRIGSFPAAVNAGDPVTINGQTYFTLQFFGQQLLIRQDASGSLLKLDREANTERVWLPLGAAVGETVQTSFDNCSATVRVASRNAQITTEIGSFDNALELRYTPNCADAGTVVQYFIPYVGLALYETTSIAGPVRHEITYARTGATAVDARTNAFTLSLDAQTYPRGQEAEATGRMTLRLSQPRTITFPSGQFTELRIFNENGESVYFWSANKLFIQVVSEERVGPGEKSWVLSFPVGQLAPGRYTAEGFLTTSPRQYSGTVSFEVR